MTVARGGAASPCPRLLADVGGTEVRLAWLGGPGEALGDAAAGSLLSTADNGR